MLMYGLLLLISQFPPFPPLLPSRARRFPPAGVCAAAGFFIHEVCSRLAGDRGSIQPDSIQ